MNIPTNRALPTNSVIDQDPGRRSQAPNGPWSRFVGRVDTGVGTAFDAFATWRRRHRDRMHLMSLDDHMLHDIGINLADVEREATKPFWRA
jgi:uncharacterized protein YjiS (DUF1127 family)